MTKTEQLEKLFNDWQKYQEENEKDETYFSYHKKNPNEVGYIPKGNFLYDGIVFEKEYEQSKTRILFIGEECHAYDKNDDIIESQITKTDDYNWMRENTNDYLNNNGMLWPFLRGIAMLSNAIIDNNYSKPNKDATVLYNVAIINLNKRGGYKKVVSKTLDGYVNEYQKEIREEIAIIDPNVIVCCGEEVLQLVENYNLADDRVVRVSFHPSCYCKSDKDKLIYLKTGIKPQKG
jgi:hypothetical protein